MVSADDVLTATARRIAPPREEPGDSFVLHAPLEVLARVGLLHRVTEDDRRAVLDRIDAVGRTYHDGYRAWTAGPGTAARFDRPADALEVLAGGVAHGRFDDVDAAVSWLAVHLDSDELVAALVDLVVPSLAAAGHGAILLHLLPHTAPGNGAAATMARTTAHELARHPDWRLTWFEDRPVDAAGLAPSSGDAGAELARRLARPHLDQRPTSSFIHPTMDLVERSGLAAELLGDLVDHLPVAEARRVLLRLAAQSMLQDDPDHAPYGWSHCLTMPQATLSVAGRSADPRRAVAVAATHVLGFRATQGSVAVDLDWAPEPPTGLAGAAVDGSAGVADMLDRGPEEAAALAWHRPAADRPGLWAGLAARAGAHHDAHLAKYTLACLDGARADPGAEHLFLAAATHLGAWWRRRDRA